MQQRARRAYQTPSADPLQVEARATKGGLEAQSFLKSITKVHIVSTESSLWSHQPRTLPAHYICTHLPLHFLPRSCPLSPPPLSTPLRLFSSATQMLKEDKEPDPSRTPHIPPPILRAPHHAVLLPALVARVDVADAIGGRGVESGLGRGVSERMRGG